MVVDDGLSVTAVCRGQDLGETAVRRWVDRLKAEQAGHPGEGRLVGRHRVGTLMRRRGLRPVWRRRFVSTTQRDTRATVADNHLDRQFAPVGPDQAGASDTTCFPTVTGWSYLAVILDL
jgi:transposase InsO family protein